MNISITITEDATIIEERTVDIVPRIGELITLNNKSYLIEGVVHHYDKNVVLIFVKEIKD